MPCRWWGGSMTSECWPPQRRTSPPRSPATERAAPPNCAPSAPPTAAGAMTLGQPVACGPVYAFNNGLFTGVTLNGNSGSRAVGVQLSNAVGYTFDDLAVQGFSGTDGAGIWLDDPN